MVVIMDLAESEVIMLFLCIVSSINSRSKSVFFKDSAGKN